MVRKYHIGICILPLGQWCYSDSPRSSTSPRRDIVPEANAVTSLSLQESAYGGMWQRIHKVIIRKLLVISVNCKLFKGTECLVDEEVFEFILSRCQLYSTYIGSTYLCAMSAAGPNSSSGTNVFISASDIWETKNNFHIIYCSCLLLTFFFFLHSQEKLL